MIIIEIEFRFPSDAEFRHGMKFSQDLVDS